MNDDLYYLNRFTGTDIVVDESDNGVVEKLNFTCASTQGANPTPDAPIPIYSSGDGGKITMWSHKKNMFNCTSWERIGVNTGVLYPSSSSYVVFNNFTNNSVNFYNTANYMGVRSYAHFVQGNTSYSISELITASDTLNRCYVEEFDSAGNLVKAATLFNNLPSGQNTHSITTTLTTKTIKISYLKSTSTGTLIVDNIQLELGPATPYEPYFGSTTDITLPKNLFNGIYTEYAIGGSSTKQYFTSPGTRTAVINVNPLTTYTIKKVGGNRFNICENDTYPIHNEELLTQLYYNSNDSQATVTTGANGRYLCIYTTNDGTNPQMQVELGSTATAYEPYVGYVGGSLPNRTADTDTQQKIGKVVFNGSEAGWLTRAETFTDCYAFQFPLSSVKFASNPAIANILCDKLNWLNSLTFLSTSNGEGISTTYSTDGYIRIKILKARLTANTVAALLTFLSTSPLTVIYQLVTPVDITITKPQIPTYEGINYITTTNNVKPSLTIEAWKR